MSTDAQTVHETRRKEVEELESSLQDFEANRPALDDAVARAAASLEAARSTRDPEQIAEAVEQVEAAEADLRKHDRTGGILREELAKAKAEADAAFLPVVAEVAADLGGEICGHLEDALPLLDALRDHLLTVAQLHERRDSERTRALNLANRSGIEAPRITKAPTDIIEKFGIGSPGSWADELKSIGELIAHLLKETSHA